MAAIASLEEQAPYLCAKDVVNIASSQFVDHKARLISSNQYFYSTLTF